MPANESDGFTIREYTAGDRGGLEVMYLGFLPRGGARGLPPRRDAAALDWLRYLDRSSLGLIARDNASGNVVGHAVLAPSGPAEAELAVFVHQSFRSRGIGGALARKALDYARRRRFNRLWAAAAPSNDAAIRMVKRCGFQVTSLPSAADIELEILLRYPSPDDCPGP